MNREDLTKEEKRELDEAIEEAKNKVREEKFDEFKKRKIEEVRESYLEDDGLKNKVNNLLSKAGTGASKLLEGLFPEDEELSNEEKVNKLKNMKREKGFMKSLIGDDLKKEEYSGNVFSANNSKKSDGGDTGWV